MSRSMGKQDFVKIFLLYLLHNKDLSEDNDAHRVATFTK